ncbi:TPA: glycosyltransferase family 4 protein [Patescibacteria group bacterium]|nr:glycosyltransferase family 4 protein [Patescibacteria group bacterium]
MKNIEELKIAIVADWLASRGGAERVVLALSEIFPQANIFTSVYKPELFPELARRKVITSFLQTMPLGKKHQLWPTLRPLAFELLNLDDYDIVISSASAEAKGVLTKPETLHVCYCHTPTRYYWSHYHYYLQHPEFGWLNPAVRFVIPNLIHKLRLWDRVAADRVDVFLANSRTTQSRIKKYYERESTVIHPPVDTARFSIAEDIEDYYLIVGRQTAYKRTDLAIAAFNSLKLPLKVIGTGPALKQWMLEAKNNISFLGRLSDAEVAHYLSHCRALIMPQEEDAGIVPLEASASGRPVVAYRGGGALDTIIDGKTGIFFDQQTPAALAEAVIKSQAVAWQPEIIRQHAKKFDKANFQNKIKEFIDKSYQDHLTLMS